MDVELEIRSRIRERGRITFAEFMDLALFWPRGGYYSNRDSIGPERDYYTAPSAHPAFGALLSLQVYQVWLLLERPATFWVVEMGAGGGLLCRDLVGYGVNLAQEFQESLRYLSLDRIPSHGAEERLPIESAKKVDRIASHGIPLRGIQGCVISNELVDSFPVHRVNVQGGSLKEIYVTLEGDKLVEAADSPSTPTLEMRLESLGVSLPEGSSAEINLAMGQWIEEVASAMERGYILTIDYGYTATELYSHARRRGTLGCFYRHTATDSPYLRVGRQDITAHVDFTSLVEEGRKAGLETLGFSTQREFFENLGLRNFIGRLTALGLKQRDLEANRMGMLEIARPGGMGEFKVLAQGKGVGTPPLLGFGPSAELMSTLTELPVPLLTPDHMPLLAGRYPHLAFDWEELLP